MPKLEEIINQLSQLSKFQDGIFLYLPEISDFEKKEIKFHNLIHNAEEEIHQLNALRNQYYHNYFKKWLLKLPADSVILEIGAGSGYDLSPLLKKSYPVIASDISLESIKAIKQKIDQNYPQFKNQIIYLVADGQNLPLADNSAAATFMVAAFHHFENQQKALQEILRVTKKGGLIIMAMEPSRFMMRFTKLFSNYKNLTIHHGHSEADETHQGYYKKDFQRLINNRQIVKIKRVWLLFGFLHYGLEAIYRLFKLKKRIKIPRLVELALLILDEILLKIPLINQLNWHWVVILTN